MATERRTIVGIEERVGNALVDGAFLTREQLLAAQAKARATNRKLSEVLLSEQIVTPETLATVLSFQLGVPVVELRQYKIQPEAVALVPEAVARERNVLPLSLDGDTLRVAMEDPHDVQLLDTLAALTRKRIKPVLPLRGGLKESIDANYKSTSRMAEELTRIVSPTAPTTGPAAPPPAAPRRLEAEAVAQAPAVKAVDTVIAQAVKDRASDIHVVPTEAELKVYYRIDGTLHEVVSLPMGVHQALTSRVKVLAGMDIAERRRPQDGQFTATVEDREINFRVATAETHHGEMMVLRVLDKGVSLVQLSDLGFQPPALASFESLLKAPFGMIMVSGPTGSGKTTTLYSALTQLTGKGRNIMTVEDPIEYQFEGVNQIQVNRQAGITFAVGLRAIMRLDPDIILVGEIRDQETAEIAIQAALTGHLVLSTIHANDSAAAIVRLIDMGIEPFLVTSAVIGSVAQRLVRKLCPYCRTMVTVPPDVAMAFQQEMGEVRNDFYQGRGCNFCSYTSFRGRIGVFEVLPIAEQVRLLISKQASAREIKEQGVKGGMLTMRRDGMLKAKDGVTTPAEVVRSVFTID
ncbi:MAG: type II/IV secretion system protein [Chloroflexi bacterium]|nr:type II/IV secretion system protein [Chloroflexota bacterium]